MYYEINNRQDLVKAYFKKNNIEIACMGRKEQPLIVDFKTGEALNCTFSNDSSGLVFRFNQNIKKKIFIPFDGLLEDNNLNFNYWFKTSTKKKIYIFQSGKEYFQRYNVKERELVPIFTPELDGSYFVFRLEKALIFQQKMIQQGILLKIIREWENRRKTC